MKAISGIQISWLEKKTIIGLSQEALKELKNKKSFASQEERLSITEEFLRFFST